MRSLQPSEHEILFDFTIKQAESGRSEFPGMSYEEGIQAVLDLLEDVATVEEVIGV